MSAYSSNVKNVTIMNRIRTTRFIDVHNDFVIIMFNVSSFRLAYYQDDLLILDITSHGNTIVNTNTDSFYRQIMFNLVFGAFRVDR